MNRTIAILVCLFLVPSALAGTAEEPEITDASGDSTSPQSGLDIVSVWIDDQFAGENLDQLFLHVEVAGDHDHLPAFFALSTRIRVDFGIPSGEFGYVHVSPTLGAGPAGAPTGGPEAISCRGGIAAGEDDSQDIESEVALTGQLESETRFGCLFSPGTFGLDAPGSVMAGLRAQIQLVQRGPSSGGDAGGDLVGVNVLTTYDAAPDDGRGPDFVVPFEAPPSIPEFNETLDTPAAEVTQQIANQSAIYRYNWTGSNETLLFLNANIAVENGTVGLRITDPAGAEAFNETIEVGNRTIDEVVSSPGEGSWTIELTYDQATASVDLRLGPEEDASSSTGTNTTTSSSTSSSSSSTTDDEDKDTPLGLLVPFLGLLVGVGIARRRLQ